MPHAALAACLSTALILGSTNSAAAAGRVTVAQAWSRATAGASMPAAIFVTLQGGGAPDELVAVTTPVAAKAMLHSMDMSGGMMRMRMVSSMAVPAGGRVTLGPDGDHIMLTGLAHGLSVGETFPATFRFRHAGDVTATVHVAGPGASVPP